MSPLEQENSNLSVLSAKGLYKSYPLGKTQVSVLKGIDFEVKTGEWVAILGASGSGKTTLLNLLGALETPDQGEIRMGDILYSSMSATVAARFRLSKIGFIFQFYHLLPELTVLENVMLPAMLLGEESRSSVRRRAITILESVGLGHRLNHLPSELSGGEQQRGAIARAFINSPPLILADEPTGNLDSETGHSILEIFRKMHDNRKTLVMVTHDHEVASFANRIVRVKDGRNEE